ncbi:hypothetical protein [Nocardia neocaledoniensis]|uniref:hypothetical protein n=1 Tax=Nocardia neocaledoniensis TaxID=236511 RepID=UPI002455DA83|nr:hypothetical protein [Nocardia neocaledoniensis]
MLRRLIVAAASVVLSLGSTACEEPRPVPVRVPIAWNTAPTTDEQHLAVMAAARAIDPCALIPRATLGEIGTVPTVVASAPDTCAAELNSTEFGAKTRVSWSLNLAPEPLEPFEGSTRTQIGDATVFAERPRADAEPGSMARTCMATARFPATIGLFVQVSTPLADEPCAVVDTVLPRALELLRTEPAVGTSPDTPKTPLAVADPCAVLATLGVSTPLAKRFLHACVFEYRGVDIDLQYVYNDRALVAVGAPILVVNGHPGYDLRSITETSWYGAILGAPLSPAGPTSSTGPRVPAVKLTGRDPAVLREVLGHTMDLFPAT